MEIGSPTLMKIRWSWLNIFTHSSIHGFTTLVCKTKAQVEVSDGKSIYPDQDERTTGVSCVQIYIVWR